MRLERKFNKENGESVMNDSEVFVSQSKKKLDISLGITENENQDAFNERDLAFLSEAIPINDLESRMQCNIEYILSKLDRLVRMNKK